MWKHPASETDISCIDSRGISCEAGAERRQALKGPSPQVPAMPALPSASA